MTVAEMITTEAQVQSVPVALAVGVARAESNLNPAAPDSAAGAIGVFQLLPSTAAQLGVDPRDLAQNIRGGVSYLRQLLARFGDAPTALAAYNWGLGNVTKAISKWGAEWFSHIPLETAVYITKILGWLPRQTSAPFTAPEAMRAAAAPVADTMQAVLILAALGIGAYFLVEALE